MNGHMEDQLDEKLLQVNVDLDKVGGGLIGEHEEQQQDPRMIGKVFFSSCWIDHVVWRCRRPNMV